MNIKTSENFPPTVGLDAVGDVLEGTLKEIRYVDTSKGQFPIAEFIDVEVYDDQVEEPANLPVAQMWISRKNLRPLEKKKTDKPYKIECTGAEGGFKGYQYEITAV